MSDTVVKNPSNGTTEKEVTRPMITRRVTYTPQVDILELSEELVLVLDMPGVKAEGIDIHFERGELIVKGVREIPPVVGQSLVQEFVPAEFYRAFLISQDVAADRITAEMKNGVLTIHMPKAAAALPRRISVKGN